MMIKLKVISCVDSYSNVFPAKSQSMMPIDLQIMS